MGGTINAGIPRVKKDILKKFKGIPTTVISDSLNRMNTMHAGIKPLITPVKVVGQAITVQAMAGCNIGSHEAIYIAKENDVIVFDARGHTDTSVWGGIQTSAAKKRKLGGLVVDGAVRDVKEIKKSRFPVFCKGITPAGPHKGWSDNINVPVSCAGVPVIPGDIIVGDEDGVCVVPLKRAKEIIRICEETMKKEKTWLRKLNKGMSTTKILGLDRKFKELK